MYQRWERAKHKKTDTTKPVLTALRGNIKRKKLQLVQNSVNLPKPKSSTFGFSVLVNNSSQHDSVALLFTLWQCGSVLSLNACICCWIELTPYQYSVLLNSQKQVTSTFLTVEQEKNFQQSSQTVNPNVHVTFKLRYNVWTQTLTHTSWWAETKTTLTNKRIKLLLQLCSTLRNAVAKNVKTLWSTDISCKVGVNICIFHLQMVCTKNQFEAIWGNQQGRLLTGWTSLFSLISRGVARLSSGHFSCIWAATECPLWESNPVSVVRGI